MINQPLVWIDCEMTGLDLASDHLIEIAVLITDGELNIVAEGPEIIIHKPRVVMENMNEWCIQHHGASGLTKAVLESNITTADAEEQVMRFLKKHIPSGVAPLAGNSVHADKQFLQKEMPRVVDYLHYRIVDVSTIKELTRRWYPSVASKVTKKNCHRALEDIRESIRELEFYRQRVFCPPSSVQ